MPLMFHEIVEVRSWMDAQTLLNGIALGQITPGPIVSTATVALLFKVEIVWIVLAGTVISVFCL